MFFKIFLFNINFWIAICYSYELYGNQPDYLNGEENLPLLSKVPIPKSVDQESSLSRFTEKFPLSQNGFRYKQNIENSKLKKVLNRLELEIYKKKMQNRRNKEMIQMLSGNVVHDKPKAHISNRLLHQRIGNEARKENIVLNKRMKSTSKKPDKGFPKYILIPHFKEENSLENIAIIRNNDHGNNKPYKYKSKLTATPRKTTNGEDQDHGQVNLQRFRNVQSRHLPRYKSRPTKRMHNSLNDQIDQAIDYLQNLKAANHQRKNTEILNKKKFTPTDASSEITFANSDLKASNYKEKVIPREEDDAFQGYTFIDISFDRKTQNRKMIDEIKLGSNERITDLHETANSDINDKGLDLKLKENEEILKIKRDVKQIINSQDIDLDKFLTDVNRILLLHLRENSLSQWKYETNITKQSRIDAMYSSLKLSRMYRTIFDGLKTVLGNQSIASIKDKSLRRQAKVLMNLGSSVLPDEKFVKFQKLLAEMTAIYSTATICPYNDKNGLCNLRLESEINDILTMSRDPDELEYIWVQWRNNTGRKVRKYYSEYVKLINYAARKNNYSNAADQWLDAYSPMKPAEMKAKLNDLWLQVKPLYRQLHAFVRYRLRKVFGANIFPEGGCIPAHLLGDMWGQTWSNIYNITIPFENQRMPDISEQLMRKNYTPIMMFKMADNFFQSLNMPPMTETFWNKSVIQRPDGGKHHTKMVCHPSAWNMYQESDFRIKMCTEVKREDLIVIHHEMGHIQYYMHYQHLPVILQDGANPGFHEAIGDLIGLSVSTPDYLKKVGLLDIDFPNQKKLKQVISNKKNDNSDEINRSDQEKQDINFLLLMALDKVAFLPFGYLVDLWRWAVFDGSITERDYNKYWWQLRYTYQGICPPSTRSEDDFDPGSKYHIVAGEPYIRYFVSFIIQFQFHRALCEDAGQVDPHEENESDDDVTETDNVEIKKYLHRCNLFNCASTGDKLSEMLKLGSSMPWPDALQSLTGTNRIDASDLLKFFEPLSVFLTQENERVQEEVGWLTEE